MTGVTTPDPQVAAVVSAVQANTSSDGDIARQAHIDAGDIETAINQTNDTLADLQATLTAEEESVLQANGNYSYSLTWNPDGTIATKTRTLGIVSQTKTFTYDTNGNLTNISGWV